MSHCTLNFETESDMRSIEISEETFKRLRQAAKSDETSELVIKRLLGEVYKTKGMSNDDDALLNTHLENAKKLVQEEPPAHSLIDYKNILNQQPKILTPTSEDSIEIFKIGYLPQSVAFTKILEAAINGEPVSKQALSWNALICELIKTLEIKHSIFEPERYLDINIAHGERNEKGYRFVPELNCSMQGVDANTALRFIMGLAQKHAISIDLLFGWRNKKGALYPSKFGRVLIDW